jgi:hypothetical protein
VTFVAFKKTESPKRTIINVMKGLFTVLLLLSGLQSADLKKDSAFQEGEWFKFEMSYSGFLKAGEGTLTVNDTILNGKPVHHVIGKGWTTGAISWFFKVEDRYESFFDKDTNVPYKFIRKVDEGGHTKDIEIDFNQEEQKAIVKDKKNNKVTTVATEQNVQDMVSAFYYLRNNYDTDKIRRGDVVTLNMFFDEENYGFRLKYLGRQTIKTPFGKVKTLKFRPYVLAGRVFKEEESLTLWVSADKNKIPLKVKADLAVGSLRADLVAFKGLKHSFQIQYN